MSAFCEGCQKVKRIPACSTNITLGNVGENTTDCLAIIADQQTGREWLIPFTTTGAGVAIIDLSDAAFISENFLYSVKVIEGTDLSNYNNPLPITIGAVEYDCLYMDFTMIIDNETGEYVGAEDITVEVEG